MQSQAAVSKRQILGKKVYIEDCTGNFQANNSLDFLIREFKNSKTHNSKFVWVLI